MEKATTSDRLKQLMLEKNLRQTDILKMTEPYCKEFYVKMNKSDISQYVSGKNEPNQDKLFVLAKALGVSEAWLMGYDVPITPVKEVSKNIFISNLNLMMIIALEPSWHHKYETLKMSKDRLEELQLGKIEPTMDELDNISDAFNISKDNLLTIDLTSPEGKPILDKWLAEKKEWELMEADMLLEDGEHVRAKKEIIYQIMLLFGTLNIDCLKEVYDYVSQKSITKKNLDENMLLFEYIIYENDDFTPVNKKELEKARNEIKQIKELNRKIMSNMQDIIDISDK